MDHEQKLATQPVGNSRLKGPRAGRGRAAKLLIGCVLVILLCLGALVAYAVISLLRGGSDGAYAYSPAIDLDSGVLHQFTGTRRSLLLRHLAADARWSVRNTDEGMIAVRREEVGGVLQYDSNGIYQRGYGCDDNFLQEGVSLSFEPTRLKRRLFDTEARSPGGQVCVRMRVPGSALGQPGYESRLVLQSDDLAILVYEQSKDPSRRFTQEKLQLVEDELREVLLHQDEIAQRGYVASVADPRSLKKSEEQEMTVAESSKDRGIYQVYAYINGGEPGVAYVKAFDARKGASLFDDHSQSSSEERVGWSHVATEKWFYNAEITIFEGNPNRPFKARFELWFAPDSGGADRKLCEAERTVYAWER